MPPEQASLIDQRIPESELVMIEGGGHILFAERSADAVDAIIERTLAHFRSRDVPGFSWWIGPGTQPTDLGMHLADHRLIYSEGGPGMAVDMLELNEDLPVPTGLTIEPVKDTAALRGWAYASVIGFEVPETYVDLWN